MKNSIKAIRIIVYSIILLIIMGVVYDVIIAKYVDYIKNRNILVQVLLIMFFLFVIILTKTQKLAAPRVTILDILSIAILIVSIVGAFAHMWKENPIIDKMVDTFQGNNGYNGFFSDGTGNKGYNDIEKALYNVIKKKNNFNKLEEIYRIQLGEKIFAYFKEDEKNVVEFAFYKENDLYYDIGNACVYVLYDDIYTTEETIRHDIVYTMLRGAKWDEIQLGAPAWGVSTDERIASMTINDEPVDDVILVNEIDGKKYYFWITTNVEGIETIDDVKAAEIEMNNLQ